MPRTGSAAVWAFGLALGAASASAHVNTLHQQAGRFDLELGVPPDGIRAAQPTDLFLRVLQQPSGAMPNPAGVSCGSISSGILMPSMTGMPAIVPGIRWMGYPGSYALRATFPHGGFYRVAVNCIPGESQEISVGFLVEVADPLAGESALPPPFRLQVKTNPSYISAGKTVDLAVSVRSADGSGRIGDFEEVHEKQLHLFLISEDLGLFFHEHPALNPDGTFTLSFRFPAGGNWRAFAEVAPRGSGSHILSATLLVHGPRPGSSKELIPAGDYTDVQEGISLHREPPPPVAHKSNWLVFTLTDAQGRKLSGLEPWLGAPAHLMMVERDAATFVHSHPAVGFPQAANEGLFAFEARFPKAGLYKGWLQFKRSGRIVTLTFVVRVAEGAG